MITDEYKAYLGMAKVLPHSASSTPIGTWTAICHGANTIAGFLGALEARHVRRQDPQREPSWRTCKSDVDEFCQYRYNLRPTADSDSDPPLRPHHAIADLELYDEQDICPSKS